MKTIIFVILQFCAIASLGQVSFGEPVKINENWKFQKGDTKEAAQPVFNDSKWRTLDLPHDWSVEGPYSPTLASATGYLPGGVAWYRKTLEIPADRNGQKVYIYFEGIYRNGEIFINGTSVGTRPNGYIFHLYEITPHIRFGEKNQIAVKVEYSGNRCYSG